MAGALSGGAPWPDPGPPRPDATAKYDPSIISLSIFDNGGIALNSLANAVCE